MCVYVCVSVCVWQDVHVQEMHMLGIYPGLLYSLSFVWYPGSCSAPEAHEAHSAYVLIPVISRCGRVTDAEGDSSFQIRLRTKVQLVAWINYCCGAAKPSMVRRRPSIAVHDAQYQGLVQHITEKLG